MNTIIISLTIIFLALLLIGLFSCLRAAKMADEASLKQTGPAGREKNDGSPV